MQSELSPLARTARARWWAILDAMLRLGVTFACLQETGVGSDPVAQAAARRYVQEWSHARNTPEAAVRLWCNADPTAPPGSGRRAGGCFAGLRRVGVTWRPCSLLGRWLHGGSAVHVVGSAVGHSDLPVCPHGWW